jgi:hypothetical protein
MTELRIHRKISQGAGARALAPHGASKANGADASRGGAAGDMVNRFIVRLEEVLFDRERMYAVLEFCELGDFFG